MNTAAKRRLLTLATAQLRDWEQVEQVIDGIDDPTVIELGSIVPLLMQHMVDRIQELQNDEEAAVGA